MLLYTYMGAPNPRRVEIFAAEKNIELELVQVNIAAGEQKLPSFIKRSPSGKIPVLEIEDGTCIAETVAISRYLEALQPEPNLFGRSALEIAQIEMQNRFIEHELFAQIGVSWVNGPIIAATGMIQPIEAAKKRSDEFVKQYYKRLDTELVHREYIASDRFTIADITALCCIEFAGSLVDLRPAQELQYLWAWHETISSRESVRKIVK